MISLLKLPLVTTLFYALAGGAYAEDVTTIGIQAELGTTKLSYVGTCERFTTCKIAFENFVISLELRLHGGELVLESQDSEFVFLSERNVIDVGIGQGNEYISVYDSTSSDYVSGNENVRAGFIIVKIAAF